MMHGESDAVKRSRGSPPQLALREPQITQS